MRFPAAVLVVSLAACASAPRGPSDAEVRATLDATLQEITTAVVSGNPGVLVNRMAPDGVLVVTGLIGGDGSVINVELTGPQQIGGFLNQVGAPPSLDMQVSAFERTGTSARQSGTWIIAGEQTGTFTIDWTQNAEGMWHATRWAFHGN